MGKSDERDFMERSHLQGYVKSEVCYGLYDEQGRLLMAMSFGKPRYDNTEGAEWELLRLCIAPEHRVVGGASKLFRHFVRCHSPRKLMSFCDYAISNGGVYERLGFSFVRLTQPSYQWANPRDPADHYSWYLINSRGFDNVFGTDYGNGTSNADLMRERGYARVYNAGNKVYVWEP